MSERQTYNLLDQPWIPIARNDGTADNVGIRCALADAHTIRNISHTAPFIEFSLYRLLITVVLDALIGAGQRPTIGRMREMLDRDQFDPDLFLEYFASYGEGFDLWGSRPFLQVPGLVEASKPKDRMTVSKMIAPVPNATKTAFWHHYTDGETNLTEAEAAMQLCSVSPFCFDYAPADICTIGGDPPLYAMVLGDSLFDSIILNLPRPSP